MYRRFVEQFRRYFFRGLLAFLPLALTIWILSAVIRVMERGQDFLPRQLRPDQYLPFYVPGIGAISTVLLILVIGVVVTHFVSHKARDLWDRALRRIPFVSTIYRSIYQVVEAIVSHDTQSFRRVVLVEYPRKGLYAIGLVTGQAGGEVGGRLGERLLSVYIPKAPNPTNGWYAIIPEREAIPLEMSVEDAFKAIMSVGLVLPERPLGLEGRAPKRVAN